PCSCCSPSRCLTARSSAALPASAVAGVPWLACVTVMGPSPLHLRSRHPDSPLPCRDELRDVGEFRPYVLRHVGLGQALPRRRQRGVGFGLGPVPAASRLDE